MRCKDLKPLGFDAAHAEVVPDALDFRRQKNHLLEVVSSHLHANAVTSTRSSSSMRLRSYFASTGDCALRAVSKVIV